MPLHKCSKDGKSGWRWGEKGVCYTGPGARKKALKQGIAINIDKFKREAELDADALEALAEMASTSIAPESEFSGTPDKDSLVGKLKETVILALVHSSNLSSNESAWSSINVKKLPKLAFANKVESKYPHHWIKNGLIGDEGYYLKGEFYLHEEALKLAWTEACQDKDFAAQAHLRKHLADIGCSYKEISYLADLTENQLKELDKSFIEAKLLTADDLDISPNAKLSKFIL